MKHHILLIALCALQIGCTNKSSSEKQNREESIIVTEMKSKITTDFIDHVVKELVVPQFESIDTLRYRNSDPERIVSRMTFKKDKEHGYYSFLLINGWVYGNIKGFPPKHYLYTIYGNITENNIDNPYKELSRGLSIWDDNDEYIYYHGDDPQEATAQYKDYLKKCEEEEKKSKKEETSEETQKEVRQFVIDGIRVVYSHRSSYTDIYKSEKKLKPNQIIKVIEKIGDNYNKGINYIGFLVDDLDYAATQCIMYPETGELYKVSNVNR